MLIGLACAFAAMVLYGFASVLQAIASRRAPTVGAGDARGIARLMLQGPYIAGLACDGVAFVISLVAFRTLPLFVVEAVLAASVGITALGATRLLHTTLARREIVLLGALVIGLAMLALSARAPHDVTVGSRWQWVLLIAALLVALIAGLLARVPADPAAAARSAIVLACCAGLAFGGLAVASRALQVSDLGGLLRSPALYALAVFGGSGLVVFALALQRGSVTAVAAMTFATETLVPAAIGLLWLGDGTRQGFAVVASAGFVLAVGAAIGLSRYAEL